jgi:catechol 2,3-dioxygenase-like lactoylglutathione lyase family enzyme
MKRPAPTLGMRHVALHCRDLAASEHFYVDLMGMKVEWRPDPDNVYLSSGNDNLALHRAAPDFEPGTDQQLDHIGFFIATPEEVDEWYAYLDDNGVEFKSAPRTHRDGARSFYCKDPEGVSVQVIYHPPIVAADGR